MHQYVYVYLSTLQTEAPRWLSTKGKMPIKHICFKNHNPTPYVDKLFKNLNEIIQMVNSTNSDDDIEINNMTNENQINYLLYKYNLIIE